MVDDPDRGAGDSESARAVLAAGILAREWLTQAAAHPVPPHEQRLRDLLADPEGAVFLRDALDVVVRPESVTAAAAGMDRMRREAPTSLDLLRRSIVQAGGLLAPVAPFAVVPLARRAMRSLVDRIILDTRPDRLARQLASVRTPDARLRLDVLSEPVSGVRSRAALAAMLTDLVTREEVDEVVVRPGDLAAPLSPWTFEARVADAVAVLAPLAQSAHAAGTMLVFDHRDHDDRELMFAVAERIYRGPVPPGTRAVLTVRTEYPDASGVLEDIRTWAAGAAPRVSVRLIKGAVAERERALAALSGRESECLPTAAAIDAEHVRCLDRVLRTPFAAVLDVLVSGDDLLDAAYAHTLATRRGLHGVLRVEGTTLLPSELRQVLQTQGPGLVELVPVAAPDATEPAVLAALTLLDRLRATGSIVRDLAAHATDSVRATADVDRLAAAVHAAAHPAPASAEVVAPGESEEATVAIDSDVHLTRAVLDIARTAEDAEAFPTERAVVSDDWVETAVFSAREKPAPVPRSGARITPDADPSIAEDRAWAATVVQRDVEQRGTGGDLLTQLDHALHAGLDWSRLPASERAAVIQSAGKVIEHRRDDLVSALVHDAGHLVEEADAAVSAVIDHARASATAARGLESVAGARFEPAPLTAVVTDAAAGLRAPAADLLAALAAGSAVIACVPAATNPAFRILAMALTAAGLPEGAIGIRRTDDLHVVLSDERTERVLVSGSDTHVQRVRGLRPGRHVAGTSRGVGSVVVMPSADLAAAAHALVRGAFTRAGQAHGAVKLVTLVGPVGRSALFSRQLVDAARALRAGTGSDLGARLGPIAKEVSASARDAALALREGESWLVEPTVEGARWTPGIRLGRHPNLAGRIGPVPVIDVVPVSGLDEAIDLHGRLEQASSAGIHTRDPRDVSQWLAAIEAGNLWVNRPVAEPRVLRQPRVPWNDTAWGATAASGGPHELVHLGRWRPTQGGAPSKSLHLRGLDSRIVAIIESAQPSLSYEDFERLRRAALSDAIVWDREFGRVKDLAGVGVERNLLRYRRVPVAVRASADASWQEVLRVVVAGLRAGEGFTLSVGSGVPGAVRRVLGDLEVPVYLESDAEWVSRMAGIEPEGETDGTEMLATPVLPARRIRLIGTAADVAHVQRELDAALPRPLPVYSGPVTTAGRLELLTFLREQVVTIAAFRADAPDHLSDVVI